MKLQEALCSISDGDVLFVYANRSSSFFAKFISKWEGAHAPYHCGILVWQIKNGTPILMLCQMDPDGNNLVPLSDYEKNHLHIVKKPLSVKIDGARLTERVGKISYSMFGAIIAGLEQYLRHIPYIKRKRQKFCSQYVIDVYNHNGFSPRMHNDMNPYLLELYFSLLSLEKIVIEPTE